MDNLFKQFATISKAGAYDIVSKQRDELVIENEALKAEVKRLKGLIEEYSTKIINVCKTKKDDK